YVDYLGPYLRRGIEISDFVSFWLSDVEREPLRRNAVVSLVEREQLKRKIEHGNAMDSLHASYVFDADYFITGDRAFYEAMTTVTKSIQGAARPLFINRAAASAAAELDRVLPIS